MKNRRPLQRSLLLLILSCSVAFAQTLPTTTAATGLEGVVSISPSRGGPARIGVTNSAPLRNTEFVVRKGDDTVATFKTDEQGKFAVSLPPGHYTVSRKEGTGRIGRYGPFEVDVVAGEIKKVHWTCDSGMR